MLALVGGSSSSGGYARLGDLDIEFWKTRTRPYQGSYLGGESGHLSSPRVTKELGWSLFGFCAGTHSDLGSRDPPRLPSISHSFPCILKCQNGKSTQAIHNCKSFPRAVSPTDSRKTFIPRKNACTGSQQPNVFSWHDYRWYEYSWSSW